MLDSLKLNIERILTPQEYPSHPYELEFEGDDWKYWLESEQAVYVNWRFKKAQPQSGTYYSVGSIYIPNPQFILLESGCQRTYQWKLRYECDHAGQPRDRRNPDLTPSKRRKTKPSMKVGCTAKIEVFQLMGDNRVMVQHYWRHTGHGTISLLSFSTVTKVLISSFKIPQHCIL